MNARDAGFLGIAAALALSALATDAKAEAVTASRPSTSGVRPQRSKPARGTKAKPDAHATLLPALTPGLQAPLAPAVPPSGGAGPVADGSPGNAALATAARLLGDGVPLELFQSVIVPAARGVTIAEIQTEGAGAVTLSVRPTKITRGSGLVATAQF